MARCTDIVLYFREIRLFIRNVQLLILYTVKNRDTYQHHDPLLSFYTSKGDE